MRISDWSSDVCSSDLHAIHEQAEQVCGLFRIVNRRVCRFCLVPELARLQRARQHRLAQRGAGQRCRIEHAERVERAALVMGARDRGTDETEIEMCVVADQYRSEEHTSELQSLMRISYAVFCLKKKRRQKQTNNTHRRKQQH